VIDFKIRDRLFMNDRF